MQKLSKEYLQELIDNAPGLKQELIEEGMSEEAYGEMMEFLDMLSSGVKN